MKVKVQGCSARSSSDDPPDAAAPALITARDKSTIHTALFINLYNTNATYWSQHITLTLSLALSRSLRRWWWGWRGVQWGRGGVWGTVRCWAKCRIIQEGNYRRAGDTTSWSSSERCTLNIIIIIILLLIIIIIQFKCCSNHCETPVTVDKINNQIR